jgi:hypothetical protein
MMMVMMMMMMVMPLVIARQNEEDEEEEEEKYRPRVLHPLDCKNSLSNFFKCIHRHPLPIVI